MSIVTKTYWCDSKEHITTAVIERSSLIWHGLHSLPYTAYMYTFFRWFYLSETTLRYFHFLFVFCWVKMKMLRMRQILWISICGWFFVVIIDVFVVVVFVDVVATSIWVCVSCALSVSFHCNEFRAFMQSQCVICMYIKCETSMFAVCHSESSGPVVPKYILINKIRSFLIFFLL